MSDEGDVDAHLAALEEKRSEFVDRCLYASVYRTTSEIRRTARAEQRLQPYLSAVFTQMNHADLILQPEVGQKAAIEMIGLLESEEQARTIQPDFAEGEHAGAVHWYSSCAYDNLAKATALLKGYNSDGMHACIAEGIAVCRRTGKMQCITCFREYATDVYRAADDLDMAMHFARAGVAHNKPGPHDRRWAGARDLVRLWLLKGDLVAAADACDVAWSLLDTWHSPLHARIDTRIMMREIALLLGDESRWSDRLTPQTQDEADPPPGEYPWLEWRRDSVEAVAHCCGGNPKRAIELLTPWDRKLSDGRCLSEWLEQQLRLLAAHKMAGNQPEFDRLAARLETKAKEARDWLTLRCLAHSRNATGKISPVPVVGDLIVSKAGSTESAGAAADPSASNAATANENQRQEKSGPPEYIAKFWERMRAVHFPAESGEPENTDTPAAILEDLLAIDPAAERSVEDVQWLLHTAGFLLSEDCPRPQLWQWAEQLARPYRQDAVTLNLLAKLGFLLQLDLPPGEEAIAALEQIEQMFRESLELDPNRHRNFSRAADFFLYQENVGEAERCLARGLRLERGDGELAKKLANIYRRTERERDALAVLDMCLREGCRDPEVLWEAAMTAYQCESHEAVVTYMDAYDKQQPGRPWVHYYRAASLLELRRFEEVFAAADEEANRSPDSPFPIAIFRAAAAAGLEQTSQALERIDELLALRLADIDYMTQQGLRKLCSLLWNAAAPLLAAHPEVSRRVEDHLLAAGLAPDEIFEQERAAREPTPDMNFYVCTLHQPLDARWHDWPGRLANEADWTSYDVNWGVLAATEEAATEFALAWQQRAFPLPATVTEVELRDSGYRDRPGVVWLGYRETDCESSGDGGEED